MKSASHRFSLPQRLGLAFHSVMGGLSLGSSLWLLNLAALAPPGPTLALELAGGLLLLGVAGLAFYSLYALRRSGYTLDRDRVVIRLGWREEVIPMEQVLAAYLVGQLEHPPPLPWTRRPGWLTGRQRWAWGEVEYLATDPQRLVLLQTPRQWYALSPSDPAAFLDTLRHLVEQGSLHPVPAHSQYPLQFLQSLTQDRLTVLLLSVGWGAGALLLLLTASVPTPPGPQGLSPAQWLLLPVVNFLFLGFGFGVGLFAHRSPRRHWMAYPIWIGNAVASLTLLGYAGLLALTP